LVRNVTIVASGTAGAQVITMAFAPLITRLYGPEAFGLLGTFVAILGIVTPLAALTYPIAIVLPKSD
jgi:O-antigen/teichoic acid export membrane protein